MRKSVNIVLININNLILKWLFNEHLSDRLIELYINECVYNNANTFKTSNAENRSYQQHTMRSI